LSLAVQGQSPTQTHYTNQSNMKEEGKVTWQIKRFFHTHQGMFMGNETGWCVHDHSLSKVIILTARFKSHLNGLTFKGHHKINSTYYILKLEIPNKN